jgi:hypothetical protein
MSEKMSGINQLRDAVGAFSRVRESFLERFNCPQLLTLWRAWKASGWDFYPNTWEDRRVSRALTGIVPTWDKGERPTYSPLETAPRIRDHEAFRQPGATR